MRKIKGSFARVLACVFLLFCVFSYNINISALSVTDLVASKAESHIVYLEASFAKSEDIRMESIDGVNFTANVELNKGSYLFRVIDNGKEFGHTGTIKDTTATVSTSGWKLSDEINAKCTLLATGGNYTFEYNVDSNKLQILKEGFATPDEAGEGLKVNLGNLSLEAKVGDKISYEIFLKADKAFEDVQSILSYNEEKLQLEKIKSEDSELTDSEAEVLNNCPNLDEVVYNSDYPGVIAANASRLEGYDFTSEKLFLSLDFTVVGTGETNIEFIIQEMSVLGGEESYFLFSSMCAEGVSLRGNVEVTKELKPTEPTTEVTETTEPEETTEVTETTCPAETEPEETTASVVTEPAETIVPSDATEPAETTPAVTTEATEADTTAPETANKTEPTETETITATQEATETTAFESEFELGDANRDGKLNIRDATLIQKFIAKIESLDAEQLSLSDYNTDGKVNIKDATLIQKKIANLI